MFNFPSARTLVRYKFSPLICLSYAEFGLSYTVDEQTFRAIAQWRCKIESRKVFGVHYLPEKPIPVAARYKVWICARRLLGCASLVSVVRCQVEVSATVRSLVQRSPTECGVSKAGITRGYFIRYSPASSATS